MILILNLGGFILLKKDKIKDILWAVIPVVILVACTSFFCYWLLKTNEAPKTTQKIVIAPQEFELLSAHIEVRNDTNKFGGIIETYKCFHYSFATSSGEIVFKEKVMHDQYSAFNYELNFAIGDKNKILQYNYPSKTILKFIMTEEMYNQVFTG